MSAVGAFRGNGPRNLLQLTRCLCILHLGLCVKETYGRDASAERGVAQMKTYEKIMVVVGSAGLLIAYTRFLVELLRKK